MSAPLPGLLGGGSAGPTSHVPAVPAAHAGQVGAAAPPPLIKWVSFTIDVGSPLSPKGPPLTRAPRKPTGIGKLGLAPCGHQGEAIVGQYYDCLLDCHLPDVVPSWPVLTKMPRHENGHICESCNLVRHTRQIALGVLSPIGWTEYHTVTWNRTGEQDWRIPAKTNRTQYINAFRLLDDGGNILWGSNIASIGLAANTQGPGVWPAMYIKFYLLEQVKENPAFDCVGVTHKGCS